MDKEEVLALIKEYLEANAESLFDPVTKSLSDTLTDYLDKRVSPIEAALTEPKTGTKTEPTPAENRLKLLEDQLAAMKAEKENADRKAEDLTIEQAISNSLAESKALHSGFLTRSLYQDIREGLTRQEDGTFLYKDGKTISDKVSEFLSTDTGKHFLPSQSVAGAGTPKVTNSPKGDGVTANDIFAAFM